jgi:hypothetical protein
MASHKKLHPTITLWPCSPLWDNLYMRLKSHSYRCSNIWQQCLQHLNGNTRVTLLFTSARNFSLRQLCTHRNTVTDSRTNWLVLRRHGYPRGSPTEPLLFPHHMLHMLRQNILLYSRRRLYKHKFLIPVVFITSKRFSISIYQCQLTAS